MLHANVMTALSEVITLHPAGSVCTRGWDGHGRVPGSIPGVCVCLSLKEMPNKLGGPDAVAHQTVYKPAIHVVVQPDEKQR